MEGKAAKRADTKGTIPAKAILESMEDGLIILDIKGKIISVNPAFENLTGYEKSELVGKNVLDLTKKMIKKENLKRMSEAVSNALKGRITTHLEYSVLAKDGREIPMLSTVSFVKDEKGESKGIVATFRDMTERKMIEKKMRLIAEEWQETFDSTKDLIMLLDGNFKIVRANKAAIDFLKVPVNEIVSEYCYRLMHGKDEPPSECPLTIMVNTHKHEEAELYIEERNIWASVSVDPLFDDEGTLIRTIHIVRDITDRKKGEDEVNRYINQLLILHKVSQEILQTVHDLEKSYVAIHQATAQLMPAEAFVISLLDESKNEIESVYLMDRGGRCPPRRLPRDKGLSGYVISSGKTVLINDSPFAAVPDAVYFGHPDHVRSILAVPMRVGNKAIGMIAAQSYRPNAYTDEDQVLLEMLSIYATAVLENARLFDEIRISEEKYRGLFENMLEGVFQNTPDGRYLTANPALAHMLGCDSEEELLTLNARNFYSNPEERDMIIKRLEEEGEIRGVELVLKRKDGAPLIVLSNTHTVRDEQGNTVYYEGTLTDITKRKKAEEELRQSNLSLEFINDLMSHDLTNINQVTLGYLEFLAETELSEKQRKYLDSIIYSTRRNARLIENVKRIWRSKGSSLKSIDLNKYIQEAIKEINISPGKSIQINYTPTPSLVCANELIVDVVANLLDNAVKFDPSPNVIVDIFVSDCGDEFKLSVVDRGKGIPDAYKKTIFSRLERLQRGVRGTGVGLHLVKTIVESYGGEVWVEDNIPCGSVFNILLPKVKR